MKCKRVNHRSMVAIGAAPGIRWPSLAATNQGVGPVLPYFCLGSVLLFAHAALATDVKPGHDLFVTPAGSFHDFSQTPLLADFFGPGSDPFTGVVPVTGNPLGTFQGFIVGGTDTIVRRLEVADLPYGTGESDTIDIELVALSLRSVTPITVTFNGGQNPELWNLKVTLSPTIGSVGTMTITHSDSEGGTYTAAMQVVPLLTFTRVGGGGMVQLDAAEIGYHADVSTIDPCEWRHEPSPADLVVFGLTGDESNWVGPPWTYDFYSSGVCRHHGPHPAVEPTPLPPPPRGWPALPGWAGIALAGLLAVAGVFVFGNRRRQQAT